MQQAAQIAVEQLLRERGLSPLSRLFAFPQELWIVVLTSLEMAIALVPATRDTKKALLDLPNGENIVDRMYDGASSNFRESIEWLNTTRRPDEQLDSTAYSQTFHSMILGMTAEGIAEGLYIFRTLLPINQTDQSEMLD